MSTLLIDCETYSELDVTEVGGHVYAAHPSTEVMLWSVRDPDWETSLVFEEPNIWHLFKMLKDTDRIKWTKNEPLDLISWGNFDRLIAQHTPLIASSGDKGWHQPDNGLIVGPNNTHWGDLMSVSLMFGGPARLENAAEWWAEGAPGKIKGKHLITRFCSPDKKTGKRITSEDDPVRWAEFVSYASRDTEVMVPMMEAMFSYSESGEDLDAHWNGWSVVSRMNERGVPIDRPSAKVAQGILDNHELTVRSKLESKYGFKPTQVAKVKEFLGTENCQRETLENLLDLEMLDEEKTEVAEARLLVSGAARKKLAPMLLHSSDEDPNVRDVFVYHGAWTRRLTSRNIQGQNFVRSPSSEAFFTWLHAKGEEKGSEIFARVRSNIRGFVKAPEGYELCAADFSSIELRVGAWLAGEQWLIDALGAGEDAYLITASNIYNEDITDKEDPRRQNGKTLELAALYQLGGRGYATQNPNVDLTEIIPWDNVAADNHLAAASLIDEGATKLVTVAVVDEGPTGFQEEEWLLTPEDAAFEEQVLAGDYLIHVYRATHPAIVKAWYACQDAFIEAIDLEPGEATYWNNITFYRGQGFIKVIRPSGFGQYYWNPKITKGAWPNGREKLNISFIGRIATTDRMGWQSTYGGRIFQGITQGTAADLILEGMENAEAAGFLPVMSIHDEVVCLVKKGKNLVAKLCKAICKRPAWAKGLPVEAEGWQQPRFTK